ncbi:DUF6241 domain-containing protein [Planococcus salinus]|uniref:Uncharacterized protein n=1 Tax=Planococcus salinus TaxID=1848460 RepID=A0A3M8P7C6_9BACL|nr:DUF6241 domain-containing protein [Planococcus salinus]RNF39589.1 hypothetical protein EEX84_08945 [Planococcus salinus]
MKAIMQTTLVVLAVLAAIGAGGYYFIQNLSPEKEISDAAKEVEKQLEKDSGAAEEAGEEVGLDETEFQIKLHQMTHQKIVASEKRGAIEMTPENIRDMLMIARANEVYYKHSDFYEETLLTWQNGDFSNAVYVHNTIWDWHNGTVGRATGLMTPEQEERYVNMFFR